MPITVDVSKEEEVEDRNLEKGVPLKLTNEQKREVVMTKYISTDNDHADWQPEGEWREEMTADIPGARRERILVGSGVKGEDGKEKVRGLQVDDGIIVGLTATLDRLVGILPGRPAMSETEVDSYLDQFPDEAVPLFQEWNFRINYMLLTNGPEGRANLARSEDQKRQQSQADMYTAFGEMYKNSNEQQQQMFTMFMEMMKAGQTALNEKGEISADPDRVMREAQKEIAEGKIK